ncbi:hypothetical protein B4N89_20680 [Embleya scabrispora]|uniref:Uncharacterized protein n=1 Tax=Embleya scabrispora TaxID=159449 RepID=A0A1T3P260_9ACTN|nr:hypothetical protein [Embleya scabrispora]OPC83031.1 hypothetical protein B4N89_20680 [Embleya scabrispora]
MTDTNRRVRILKDVAAEHIAAAADCIAASDADPDARLRHYAAAAEYYEAAARAYRVLAGQRSSI